MISESEAIKIIDAISWLLERDQGSVARLHKAKLTMLRSQLNRRIPAKDLDDVVKQQT